MDGNLFKENVQIFFGLVNFLGHLFFHGRFFGEMG